MGEAYIIFQACLKLLSQIKPVEVLFKNNSLLAMSCCPSGSWGALENSADSYQPKGVITRRNDMDIYHVGEAADGKCIIWNYDIFGINGGRTKMFCDLMAENGFLVVLPDFYRDGKFQDPRQPGTVEFLKEHTQWSKLKKDFEEIVLPFAKEHGALSFGAIGTCWGSYMVLRECAFHGFKAGISMHPSHSPISGFLGEDETDILKAVQCHQLFMPAGNDHANVKPGGLGDTILGDLLEILEFPDMTHGWTTRGDMADVTVNRDVKKAAQAALDFFKKHV